jgi:Protein of unknown function (DUF3352)
VSIVEHSGDPRCRRDRPEASSRCVRPWLPASVAHTLVAVRALAAGLAAALLTGAAACGGEGGGGAASGAGGALAYLPEDSGFVVLVSTDLEGDAMQDLLRAVGGAVGANVQRELENAAQEVGLSYDEDVEPLLGNDLVLGTTSPQGPLDDDTGIIAALDTEDAEKLRQVVEKVEGVEPSGEAHGARIYTVPDDGGALAVEGGILVVADTPETLEEALARADGDGGLTEEGLGEWLADLPDDAPVRVAGRGSGFLDVEQLARFRGLPWVDAVRSYGVAVAASDDELHVDATLNTESDDISEDDLPLATGDDTPEVFERTGEISAGNRDQSRTTVFLLRAMRHAHPDSDFVRQVDELEQELGIDFEEEVLRQFDGPSTSAVSPDGQRFAARSEVSDPEALAEAMDALAPHLPRLITSLQGLQSEGMALLFLFAPDAPVALQELDQVMVHPPAEPGGLYHATGLTGDGPAELYFGLVEDVFVVASDEEAARTVAEEPTIEAEGAQGAGVFRADLGTLADEAADQLGFFGIGGGEVVGSLEASTERLRARLRLELRGEPSA